MSELQQMITISRNVIGGEEIQTVDARELYQKLEVKTRFNDWISRRLSDIEAIDNIDFMSFTQNLVSGGKSKEYVLSLDIAKHIAMMEGTEQGKKIRQYFIEVEKAARKAYLEYKKQEEHPLVIMSKRFVAIEEQQKRMLQDQLAQAQKIIESQQKLLLHEELLVKQTDKILDMEAKTDALKQDTGYFIIMAYAKRNGYVGLTKEVAQKLGWRAKKLSKEKGIPTKKAVHEIYGEVGSYHESVLKQVFSESSDLFSFGS